MSDFEKYDFPKAGEAPAKQNAEREDAEHSDDLNDFDEEFLDDEFLDEELDDEYFGDIDELLTTQDQLLEEINQSITNEAQEENQPQQQEVAEEPQKKPILEEGEILLATRAINKVYKTSAGEQLHILNNVDIRLYSGEITALIGPSGSGKSTLLQILGLLDTATSGQIVMNNKNITKISEKERTKLRSKYIGFVYQFHHLLPEFSALENVAMPQIIAGVKEKQAHEKAAYLLEILGLGHRLTHRPATLSGGEQQRVAIARALINDPLLLFADEPTGNLDPETSEEVFEILLDAVRTLGIGALIATHNLDLANQMDRILEVKSGHILPY